MRTVAIPPARVTLPNTTCPFFTGTAEQFSVFPQFCRLGWFATKSLGTGVLDSTDRGGVPVASVDEIGAFVVIGTWKAFRFAVKRSFQFVPSPMLPM